MATGIGLAWNGDFVLNAKGGVATVSDGDKVLQRVVRRFLTNSQRIDTIGRVTSLPDYLFHPFYGGNARQYVDNPTDKNIQGQMQQNFAAQAQAEDGVAADPPSVIQITQLSANVIMNATVYLADSTVPTVGNVRLAN